MTSPQARDAVSDAEVEAQRKAVAAIIREHFDPTPSSLELPHGQWYDNAEETADLIIAALLAASRVRPAGAGEDEYRIAARDLTKALTKLTPNGSEYFVRAKHVDDYFADIEKCVSFVNEQRQSQHELVAANIVRAKAAEASLAKAVEVLREAEELVECTSIPDMQLSDEMCMDRLRELFERHADLLNTIGTGT